MSRTTHTFRFNKTSPQFDKQMTYQPKVETDFGGTTDSRIQKDQFVQISNQDNEQSSLQRGATSSHANDDGKDPTLMQRTHAGMRDYSRSSPPKHVKTSESQ